MSVLDVIPAFPPVMVFHPGQFDPLYESRDLCRDVAEPTHAFQIKNITGVGAVYSNRTKRLNPNDNENFRRAVKLGDEFGLPFVKDFVFTSLNNLGGDEGDFLKSKIPADAVFVFSVFDGHYTRDNNWKFVQSDAHHKQYAWYDAARATGAKVIFIFSQTRDQDVRANRFAARPGMPEYKEILFRRRTLVDKYKGLRASMPRMNKQFLFGAYKDCIQTCWDAVRSIDEVTILVREDIAAQIAQRRAQLRLAA